MYSLLFRHENTSFLALPTYIIPNTTTTGIWYRSSATLERDFRVDPAKKRLLETDFSFGETRTRWMQSSLWSEKLSIEVNWKKPSSCFERIAFHLHWSVSTIALLSWLTVEHVKVCFLFLEEFFPIWAAKLGIKDLIIWHNTRCASSTQENFRSVKRCAATSIAGAWTFLKTA